MSQGTSGPPSDELARRVVELEAARDACLAELELHRDRLFNFSRELMCVVAPEGGLERINRAFARLFGSPEQLLARPLWNLIHPGDRDLTQRQLRRLAMGEEAVDFEVRMRAKDGLWRWISWSCPAAAAEDGRLYPIGRDVTESKRASELAQQRQEQLAHSTRLATMGEMAAGLAHELNQPLYAIGNFADACLERIQHGPNSADDTLLQWLRDIAAQARRAGEIVRRVTAFVRKSPLRLSPGVDLRQIIQESAALMAFDARRLHVQVQLHLPADLPNVKADTILLEQVLVNLLRNAMEATLCRQPDGRRVLVDVSQSGQKRLKVAVRDNGCGLLREQLQRVFEPFYTTKPEGIGLGLSISRSIIEAHGGKLWGAANTDQGMTFHFALPVSSEGSP